MRLFWKVFFLLMLVLLLTAATSSWLSRQLGQANSEIETRMNSLASLGQTAVSLYELGGNRNYRRWLHHAMRQQHFRGGLIDAEGRHVLRQPLPPKLQRLAEKAMQQRQGIRVVRPPLLAIAIPLSGENSHYFWIASYRIPPEKMHAHSRNMLLIRIAIMLLAMALVSWLLTRMMTRPIRLLQQTSEQLGHGNLSARTPGQLSARRDELGELACSFDTMAVQIESLLHSHQQLLRDISHELRSPLARLQIALELARDETDGIARDELDRIGLEANRLNQLIGEVLTLSRFEQNGIAPNMHKLRLDQLVADIAADAAFEAETTGKQIHCSDLCECEILADRLWISRALENVIRNAIRHTVENSQVDITMHCDDHEAVIHIRDHGDGVNEEHIPHLFEAFFRASDARERISDDGYGLGLAIAKRAIELHHGHIQAINHPEGGLEVILRLPQHADIPSTMSKEP